MSDADELRATPKRAAQRERDGFQPTAVVFLKRVLISPAFVTAVIGEGELTQNARARAKQRGYVSGFPDLLAFQRQRVIGFELKWGKNKPSEAQLFVKRELGNCGVLVAICWSIANMLNALEQEEFALHLNARNLAAEFEERVAAAVQRAEIRAAKPHSKQRGERPTQARIRKAHSAGVWRRPLLPGEV